jgi:DedD protein
MDRRVKERLIGASILVVLIVLVVPELLSGPKPAQSPHPMLPAAAASEPNRTVLVDLSTSKPATATEAEEPTSQPASAAAITPTRAEPAATAAAAPNPTAISTASPPSKPTHAAAVESVAPAPTLSVRGAWSVQLGSFASRANADNLTRQMKGQGFSAFVLEGGSGAAVRYRVRVGPVPDRESAERMAGKLKSLGHASSLVAPAG